MLPQPVVDIHRQRQVEWNSVRFFVIQGSQNPFSGSEEFRVIVIPSDCLCAGRKKTIAAAPKRARTGLPGRPGQYLLCGCGKCPF
jgi:hypothetical protein